jgi:hypothetical protein
MKPDLQKFFLGVVSPILGSIVVGFVFFGGSIFQTMSVTFQFVAFGIVGGLMLATTKVATVSRSFVVLVVITVFYEFMLMPFKTVNIVRDILFLFGIGSTIILYRSYFSKRMDGTSIAHPLVLSALLALNGVVVTTILRFVVPLSFEADREISISMIQNLSFEFLIGLGLGIGEELSGLLRQWWQPILQGNP